MQEVGEQLSLQAQTSLTSWTSGSSREEVGVRPESHRAAPPANSEHVCRSQVPLSLVRGWED